MYHVSMSLHIASKNINIYSKKTRIECSCIGNETCYFTRITRITRITHNEMDGMFDFQNPPKSVFFTPKIGNTLNP